MVCEAVLAQPEQADVSIASEAVRAVAEAGTLVSVSVQEPNEAP